MLLLWRQRWHQQEWYYFLVHSLSPLDRGTLKVETCGQDEREGMVGIHKHIQADIAWMFCA
jgi:hypothetical protein